MVSAPADREKKDAMPDPLTAATIAKAIAIVNQEEQGAEAQAAATGLAMRMFGPFADEIGEALRRWANYRFRNVGRVIAKTVEKSSALDRGIVNPRVARILLEEGSYCDDELMAEYLGGVLAASRTPSGRDDRAVTWSGLITSMSSLQVRAHFLIYREWAARLHGTTDLNLGTDPGQISATTDFEFWEFASALVSDSDVRATEAVLHSVLGLIRIGLLGDTYAIGDREGLSVLDPEPRFAEVLRARPTPVGLEMYGWAQGLPGLTSQAFLSKAEVFALEYIPRLVQVDVHYHRPQAGAPQDS